MAKMTCKVCGGPLKMTDKKTICSDACRAKRSRDKRNAQKRAYDIGFQIDAFGKMLSDGVLSPDEAMELVNITYDRMWAFYEQAKNAQAVQAAKEKEEQENKPKKRGRK